MAVGDDKDKKFNPAAQLNNVQKCALILIAMGYWRGTKGFMRHAYDANVLLMTGGFLLVGYQLTGYFVF